MERARRDVSAHEILASGLAKLGLPSSSLPRLEQLSDLVARWAARLNLTAHRTPAAIARRLVLDALALGQALPDSPPASLADIGSGAGFPGLPLAIVWPACRVTLVEARARRHHFQRTAIRELAIHNAVAVLGRAEELDPVASAVVVAQAAAKPEIALGWMARWAAPGGWLVIPQSDPPEAVVGPAGVFHVETRAYQVPGGARRAAWIGRLAPA